MTRLDYCQFLPASRINYTLTYFADHDHTFSHDAINGYLRRERMMTRLTPCVMSCTTKAGHLIIFRLFASEGIAFWLWLLF
ncbi:MAG: hypothetical protein PHG00_10145 [Methylococcales bacterium]|nr:hypothetical protein [Methylococcales bacterium]